MNETGNIQERNYNTISPSAKSLLLMKGHTDIPFARQAAELVMYPEIYTPDFNRRDFTYWARVLHFESRYWSVNQLMENTGIKNILELSSGFSLRCLEKTLTGNCYYIDTDLPDMIEQKKKLVSVLQEQNKITGRLEILPLNALDEESFKEVVSHFPPEEIMIVNEGLVMYLCKSEKEKLFGIIHNILKERGGCWITSDIYLKNKMKKIELKLDKHTKEFFEQHNIEENKFNSFDEARYILESSGLIVDKEASINAMELSAFKYFRKNVSLIQMFKMSNAGKMQATWRLKIKN